MMQQSTNVSVKRKQFGNSKVIEIDLVDGNTFGRYPKISNSSTYNMIISDGCLVPFSGYKSVATIVAEGQARELYSSYVYNHLIAIVNNGVYTIDSANVVSQVGLLNTTTGPVFIAENNAGEIAIADGLNIYIFNYNLGTFTIPSIDFLPGYICFHETYFIATDSQRNQWRLSDSNNGSSWPADAQHVGEIQTKPTKAVAVVPLENTTQLIVMGQTLAESWYNTGNQLFPYSRNNYFAIDYGCLSSETIAFGFGYVVWLGSNEKSGVSIMYTKGGDPVRVSTDGIDYLFARLTKPNNSFGFLLRLDGHIYYQLTFVADNITLLYDFNNNKFFYLTDENMNHHIAKRVAFFNNQYYFVSFTDGKLYEMNSDIYTYDGKEIPRYRTLSNKRFPTADLFVVQNITLTMESGIDTSSNTYAGNPPNKSISRVDLSRSDDAGLSFNTVESTPMPPIGQRQNVMSFWNLGSYSNDISFRFGFWGFGRFVVVGGIASIYQ